MEIKVHDYPNENICFVTFTEGENYAHFKGTKYTTFIELDKFMNGNIGKYKFRHSDAWEGKETFFFQGDGRGRKLQKTIDEMSDFIQKCNNIELNINEVLKG